MTGKLQADATTGKGIQDTDGGSTKPEACDDCVCGAGPSACAYCDEPLPTAYDFEFIGVTACSGFGTPDHTVTATSLAGNTPPLPCQWEGTVSTGIVHAGLFVAGTMSVIYDETPASAGSFSYFIADETSYGPDCTTTILMSNRWVFADCGTSTAAGYGGSAAGVAVLPP